MPNNLIKHDVKKGEGTKKSLEKKWDAAEDAAGKGEDGKPNYRLTNYIYQRMKGKKKASLEAVARLIATAK